MPTTIPVISVASKDSMVAQIHCGIAAQLPPHAAGMLGSLTQWLWVWMGRDMASRVLDELKLTLHFFSAGYEKDVNRRGELQKIADIEVT